MMSTAEQRVTAMGLAEDKSNYRMNNRENSTETRQRQILTVE